MAFPIIARSFCDVLTESVVSQSIQHARRLYMLFIMHATPCAQETVMLLLLAA